MSQLSLYNNMIAAARVLSDEFHQTNHNIPRDPQLHISHLVTHITNDLQAGERARVGRRAAGARAPPVHHAESRRAAVANQPEHNPQITSVPFF